MAILVLLLVVGVCAVGVCAVEVCAVGWCVYAISTSHNHKSNYESESTKASRKKAEVKNSMDAQIKVYITQQLN